MNVQILALSDPLWPQALQTIRHDTYHLPEYVSVEAKRSQATAEAILITDDSGKIFLLPYLIRSCRDFYPLDRHDEAIFDVFSPYGYSGIILNDEAINDPDFVRLALEALSQAFKEKNICSAFVRLHPIFGARYAKSLDSSALINDGVTVSVNLLQPESKIWAQTRKGHQSTINKCKRLGLMARMVPFSDYIEIFISIYNETMDRVSAKQSYYFDQKYFEDLLRLGEKIHCCIVENSDQIVAASLFFECCGIVQAHLGGTRTAFMSQSPFSLLLHYVRLWARERGNEFLHLGGGVGGSQEDRLFRFKSGFSKQQHDFHTLRLIVNLQTYQELIAYRAHSLDLPVEQLQQSNFFPAYRTTV